MSGSAKKKLSQLELRKYMQEHKTKGKALQPIKKIESPLAKYNEQGQLTCVLCKSIVRSEAVWTVHINAKQHKENVELAKKLKERTNNFTTPLKRPLTPPHEVSSKKPKSILKNGCQKNTEENVSSEVDDNKKSGGELPPDFFDSSSGRGALNNPKLQTSSKKDELMEVDQASKETNETVLPEGFFDDPKLDARARNQEYKDPIQEEWEKFQKEIRDAEGQSAAIIAEDQEEATTERQMEEIDEQMKNLSKVLDLEKKKGEIISVINESSNIDNDNQDDDVEEEFDEFLDWRSKNSLK